MIIFENNNILSFSEYCLSESIKPREISFGINEDMNDLDIAQDHNAAYTFFKFDDLFYCVTFLKKSMTVGFGVSEKHSLTPSDYVSDRTQTRRALMVFNHVLFVLFLMIGVFSPIFVKFESANPALGKVYDRMVDNQFVLNYIENNGYRYEGEYKGVHIFRRKSRLDKE